MGNLENWAETSPWVRLLYHALRVSVNNTLRASRALVLKSQEIITIIKVVACAPDAMDAELKEVYLHKKISLDTYHSQVKIFMSKTMHVKISFLREAIH